MDSTAWLNGLMIYLAAAVLAVPLSKALGLGSVIGYLIAGIAVGPWGLGLITDPARILSFAEFGVVLMLFLVGLELEPARLWRMRVPIFGWGLAQVAVSTALMMAVGMGFGLPWHLALAGALGLAMSSTAIGLAVLNERGALPTTSGQGVLSVSLFQDVSAIPILAALPLIGAAVVGGTAEAEGASPWLGAAKAVGVIVAIVLVGRLLLRPALRWIARSDTPEIFTAASLLLVVATAALMHAVGLSMALGAFLAGVLLAESEYRRALETDLEPFKGLLLGLFFMAVGMSIDFAVVLANPGLVAAIVLGFLVVKAVVLVAMARLMPIPLLERPVFIILLAQGGEFGFVVFQAAQGAGLLSGGQTSLLIAAVAVSMLLTPLFLVAADRYLLPRLQKHASGTQLEEIAEQQDEAIIIAGSGRYGQIVGRMLFANGLKATVLDHDAEAVEGLRQFGWKAFYGDASRMDLLKVAGAERARILVLAIDAVEPSLEVAKMVRENFPHLTIVARARNVTHYMGLKKLGVEHVERETLDSALMSARSVLELMGWERHQARNLAMQFRRHSIELLGEMAAFQDPADQGKLIAISKQGRQQLEETFARERAQAAERRERLGWASGPGQAQAQARAQQPPA
jgi:glutathione-regulated potassium-efflux system ancillary protein KefC